MASQITATLSMACLFLQTATPFNIDITHPLVFSGPKDSYFGYSIALLNNSQGSWLLAGTPRSNSRRSTPVNRSGALYKCQIHRNSGCTEVKVDTEGNKEKGRSRFKPRKDNQWLGVSVDIKPSFESKVVVCSHNWADSRFPKFHYLISGMCFELNEELDTNTVQKLYPLLVRGKLVDSSGKFQYGAGLTGMAAHYSEDGSLLLGTPGLMDWKGGLVRYRNGEKDIADEFTEESGYAGYSLTSGRLYGDKSVYYVTGAPRSSNTGECYVLDENLRIISKLVGKQIGEYFCAAVVAIDVNGDGLDDLIVGAPLFTYTVDEGKAYVLINKDFGVFRMLSQPLDGSRAPGARFGTAISNLRDVNLDGFQDVVIGAPYEDEGIGAIYVYNGYKHGLRSKYSQRIQGRQLDSGLRTFGISISRVHDIDGNSYGDIAVGSYLSDTAVLLRGRPVVNLKVDIKFSAHHLNLKIKDCNLGDKKVSCFTVTVCFIFNGISLPKHIAINYTLSADTMEQYVTTGERILLREKSGVYPSISRRILLKKDESVCEKHQAIATSNKDVKDVITPIVLEVEYTLSDTNSGPSASLDPVLDPYRPNTVVKQITYLKNCGKDNVCHSDLQLETRLMLPEARDYLVSGQDSYLSHQVTVVNKGEPAYLATVAINYPSILQYVRVNTFRGPREVVCLPSVPENETDADNGTTAHEHMQVVCDIGNPVRSMETVLFIIKLYVETHSAHPDPLQITSEVMTGSAEKNESLMDNLALDYLLIRLQAGLLISGISAPEQIRLLRADLKKTDNMVTWQTFSHLYVIGNLGPSVLPLGTLYVTVSLDSSVQGKITMFGMEIIDPITGDTWLDSCSIKETENIVYDVSLSTLVPPHPDDESQMYSYSRKHRSYIPSSADWYSKCQSGRSCTVGYCTVTNLQPENSVHVRVILKVKSNIFVELQEFTSIQANSTAEFVEALDPMYIAADLTEQSNGTVVTDIYTDVRRGGVNIWVVAASASSAALVLLVITVLLCRVGFFRRKYKEDLTKLIEERGSELGSRHNTIEQHDTTGIPLNLLHRDQDRANMVSDDYEEPVISRTNGISHSHRSRRYNAS